MILAAGRGERMKPLTDTIPKPLLKIKGQELIVYHLKKLASIGISDIVINHAWLGDQIVKALGTGARYGLNIVYSPEPKGALETAGGIFNALDKLGQKPFLVINADIFTDMDFSTLKIAPQYLAHLVLVKNPEHNQAGDFGLKNNQLILQGKKFTYSGVGLYRPEFFKGLKPGKSALAPLLTKYIAQNKVSGQIHKGLWSDVGTVARLRALEE